MTDEPATPTLLELNRVLLDSRNPRHEPLDTQDDLIAFLCEHEYVLALARDIVLNGLNPLELFAVVRSGENMYVVAEGNRRLCALKLLDDPDLAPAPLRKDFEQLASEWTSLDSIAAIEFDSRADVRLWLDRDSCRVRGRKGSSSMDSRTEGPSHGIRQECRGPEDPRCRPRPWTHRCGTTQRTTVDCAALRQESRFSQRPWIRHY